MSNHLKIGDEVRLSNSPFGRYCRGVVESMNGSYVMVRMNLHKELYEALSSELRHLNKKENSMSDLPRGNLSNDDPHEFGAGIEITQQAKYWRDRSQVWMRRAIELGWDAEKQAKCDTCNGTMIVGGFVHGVAPGYEDHPCPDCNPRAVL